MGRDIAGLWDGLYCLPTSAEKADIEEVEEVDILHLFRDVSSCFNSWGFLRSGEERRLVEKKGVQ